MNDDIIFHIQEYISDFDFLYNISLIDTRFCIRKRRKLIQNKNNSLHLLKTFIHDDMDYVNDFININTLSETIQWYANVLLSHIPFYKYEYVKQNHYKWEVKRFSVSHSINNDVYIRNYPVKLHFIYRCLPLMYHNIQKSLQLKALIF